MEVDSGDPGSSPDGSGLSRRTFLKRMALIGFAAPVIASFALDAAYATPTSDDGSGADPDLIFGNQQPTPSDFFPNQVPTQYFANQSFPNANQSFPNQYGPNQFYSNQTSI